MPDIVLDTTFTAAGLPSVPVIGFSDNFNRADAATLGSTSGELKPWLLAGATSPMTLSGNRAVSPAAGTVGAEYVDAQTTDGTLTATQVVVGTRQVGLVARHNGGSSMIRLSSRASSSDFHYQLQKVVSGVSTIIGTSATVTSQANDVIQLITVGDQVSVKVNGTLIIGPVTVADAALQTGTFFGFYIGAVGAGSSWDNISFVH